MAELEQLVRDGLAKVDRKAFDRQLNGRNLEQALSRIRRIEALLEDGKGEVDGLTAAGARRLDHEVCRLVVEHLGVDKAILEPVLRFGMWAAQADYDEPLELFTVNYDLLLETALEQLAVAYFDGFVGALRARFRADLIESGGGDRGGALPSFLVRLWKLHGSINWEWQQGARTEVARLGDAVASSRPAAIYPSDAKYDESRRVPFVVLQDRLRRALAAPETLVLISGYSWSDAHLNEVLLEAARHRPRTELVAFSHDALPEALVGHAESLPNLQAVAPTEAIIGGVRADWDSDVDEIPDVWDNDACLLGDFSRLAALLARSSPRQGEMEQRFNDYIATLAGRA